MKRISKFIALTMAAILTFSISPALLAEAKTLDPETVYMESYYYGDASFSIENLTKVDSVKSSDDKVLGVSTFYFYKNERTYYYNNKSKNRIEKASYGSTDKGINFDVIAHKPGSATISVKSGNKKYTKKITVKEYTNPISSLVISNVNKGKNISGKFKSESLATFSGASAKTIKVKAKAKSGWEIAEIKIFNRSNENIGHSSESHFKKGTTTAVSTLNHINNKVQSDVYIYCVNKKNKGRITLDIHIKAPAKK